MRQYDRSIRFVRTAGAALLCAGLLAVATPAQTAGAQNESIHVEEPRPLAALALELQSRWGIPVTYEDPVYAHEGDMADVTLQVRKDLDRFEKGKAPRVMVPAKGSLDLSYAVSAETGRPEDPAAALQQAVEAHAAAGHPGRFRVARDGEAFHLVPVAVRDRGGRWAEQGSALDVRIDLPEAERSVLETVRAILDAAAAASGNRVDFGMVPAGALKRQRVRVGASGEVARQVLARALAGLEPRLSWRLLYDPGLRMYALNLRPVGLGAR